MKFAATKNFIIFTILLYVSAISNAQTTEESIKQQIQTKEGFIALTEISGDKIEKLEELSLQQAEASQNSSVIGNPSNSTLNQTLKEATLKVPTKEGIVTIKLEKNEIRGKNYYAEITDEFGTFLDKSVDNLKLYKGRALIKSDKPNKLKKIGVAAFSLTKDHSGTKIFGYIKARKNFYKLSTQKSLNPLTEFIDKESTSNLVVQINEKELKKQIAGCASLDKIHKTTSEALEHVGDPQGGSNSTGSSGGQVAFAGLKEAEVATEADYDFYQLSDGNPNSRILSIINAASAIYEQQLGITFKVIYQHAFSSNSGNPYSTTSAVGLLQQFEDYWQANFRPYYKYDVAHFFTGKDLDGSTAGVAYISALCQSFSYGLSKFYSNLNGLEVPLFAHEIGHNFGAEHTSNTSSIMDPYLILNANSFAQSSKNQISVYTNSVSCLSTITPNSPPVLNFISNKQVNEGQTLSFNLSGTDPDGDPVTFEVDKLPDSSSLNGTKFTYVPSYQTSSGSSVVQTLKFTIRDSKGSSSSQNVNITVYDVNTPPSTQAYTNLNAKLNALLSFKIQATDAEGEPISFSLISNTAPGLIFGSDGLLTWDTKGKNLGTYGVNFKVQDSKGNSATGYININLVAANNLPKDKIHYPNKIYLNKASSIGVKKSDTFWQITSLDNQNIFNGVSGSKSNIAVIGDYDGDGSTDVTFYDPQNSVWYITFSTSGAVNTVSFGLPGDAPLSGDFDGDGKSDLSVYRSNGNIFSYLKSSTGQIISRNLGFGSTIPLPCDYDGDKVTDVAVWSPHTLHFEYISSQNDNYLSSFKGSRFSIPLPNDYLGTGRCQFASFDTTSGTWEIESLGKIQLGLPGDLPNTLVSNNKALIGVFRASTGESFIVNPDGSVSRNVFSADNLATPIFLDSYFAAARSAAGGGVLQGSIIRGEVNKNIFIGNISKSQLIRITPHASFTSSFREPSSTQILQGDFDGDKNIDNAFYYNGSWKIYLATGAASNQLFGAGNFVPLIGDFDGDGISDKVIFAAGAWLISYSSSGREEQIFFGSAGLIPMVNDFNGDGLSDLIVFNPSNLNWTILDYRSRQTSSINFGDGKAKVFVADIDGDFKGELISFSSGFWKVRFGNGEVKQYKFGDKKGTPLVISSFITNNLVELATYKDGKVEVYEPKTQRTRKLSQKNRPSRAVVLSARR